MAQSRRHFFRNLLIALGLPAALWWGAISDKMLKRSGKDTLELSADLPNGISIIDGVIINNAGGEIKILSAECTHLGCSIDIIDGDKLICPCHGSAFDSDGKAVQGPASKSLRKLDWNYNKSLSRIIVKLP